MVTALESKAALSLVTAASLSAVTSILENAQGSPEAQRALLLDSVPEVIGYYSAGSAALAADFYDDERERQAAPKRFMAEPIIADRAVKIREYVAWAADPLFGGDLSTAIGRLTDVTQLETARPYRDTILTNRRRDPSAVGWQRLARAGGCRFCRMLADKGAVYRKDTARFAAHGHCQCTAQPVFSSNDFGEEASAMQYLASKRNRTPAQKSQLREYLNLHYPTGSSRAKTVNTKLVEPAPRGSK